MTTLEVVGVIVGLLLAVAGFVAVLGGDDLPEPPPRQVDPLAQARVAAAANPRLSALLDEVDRGRREREQAGR